MKHPTIAVVALLALTAGQLAIAGSASADPTNPSSLTTAVTPGATPTPAVTPTPDSTDPGFGDAAPESDDTTSPSGPTTSPASPSSSTPTTISSSSPSTSPSRTATTTAAPPTTPSPSASGPKIPITVAVEFDDGTADQYQTSALLKARSMSGVYFINSGRLGLTDEYLSADQATALQAAGNEIGGHTAFHLHLPQQVPAEQQRQICADRDQLLALGLKVTDMAVPFGEFTATTQTIARQCGYSAVRTSEDASKGFDTLPPANQFQLGAVSSLGATTTVDYITSAVIKAEQTDSSGGLVQLVFHRVCAVGPCRDSAIRLSVFTQVLDWLAAQRQAGRVVVRTLAQALSEGAPKPTVAAPAPTATTVAVVNPSFEAGTSADGVPTCWEHTTSGDGNTANWSLVRGGHSGDWAQHLDAPLVSTGVGLVVTQDLGSCAAPVVVGDRYSYSVWYKSTAPVQLVAYRRLTAGGYLSYGLSPAFPASPDTWAFATVITRAFPEGSTGISIGVSIKSAGQYTFDDFSLGDAGPTPSTVAASVAQENDTSTPSAVPLAIPLVAAAHVTEATAHSSWTGWIGLGAVLLLAAIALGFVDRRLARRRHRLH